MSKVCFLDLDGVLVDFVRGAFAIHQTVLPISEVKWNFPLQMGFTAGANDPLFWAPMGYDFWRTLDWTGEGKELIAGLESIFGQENIALMTSPCDTAGSVEGKVDWVRYHLPAYRRQFFVGPAKHLAAGAGKFLIDDHDANCAKFALQGGVALAPPRPWNMRYTECGECGDFDVAIFLAEVEASL